MTTHLAEPSPSNDSEPKHPFSKANSSFSLIQQFSFFFWLHIHFYFSDFSDFSDFFLFSDFFHNITPLYNVLAYTIAYFGPLRLVRKPENID
ncbi:hypothetical protein BKA91DRAFT_42220 [Yarrowia lipolytica]|nr:hypothetical protein BKA91DRAFT_42220 [Yarrowia lipolytica]KAE8170100.1 hypothetical protein BKA90DRAFT_40257 [Yarrowia lipolytica]RMI96897.1 hypothetical protein BD777DRAFT_45929 [Yarrowia lipolytica]